MSETTHPNQALFAGEKRFPIINACEHFAGSEKLITKAMELQDKMGGVFDITMDCEDGAKAGQEKQHAEMVVEMAKSALNKHRKAGVRIHDFTHMPSGGKTSTSWCRRPETSSPTSRFPSRLA